MNTEIKNKTLAVWLAFFFFTAPIIIDFFNGLFIVLDIQVPLSAFYRILLLIVSLFFIKYFDIKILFLIFIFLLLFIASNLVWLFHSDNYNLFREIQQFIRIVFPYFLVGALYYLNQYIDSIKMFKFLIYFGLIASLLIIFSYFTGIGIDSYGNYAFGVKSFFNAGNDISLSLLLILIVSLYVFTTSSKNRYLLYSFFILGALFLLGTRSGLIGGSMIFLTFIFLILFYKENIKLHGIKKYVIIFFSFLFLMLVIIKIVALLSEYNYMIERYTDLLEISPRVKSITIAYKRFENYDMTTMLMGESSYSFSTFVANNFQTTKVYLNGKFIEQDILDMYGSYGIVLGGLFLSVPFLLWIRAIYLSVRYGTLFATTLLMCMTIFLLHSFFAGHAINSPTVATVISIIYYYILEYNVQEPC